MININMYNITSAEATAIKGAGWVIVKTDNGSEVAFFMPSDKCKAIADIINGTGERLTVDQMFADSEK